MQWNGLNHMVIILRWINHMTFKTQQNSWICQRIYLIKTIAFKWY